MLLTNKIDDLLIIIKIANNQLEERRKNLKHESERDKNYLSIAEKFLFNELSISLNKSLEDIKKIFYK